MSLDIDVKTAKTGFLHFPKTFYAVLFIEFWERFAFYGLQSVAVIYFIQKFGIKESVASDLFSSFSAMLYAMLTIGGAIGDKLLGLRRTYLLGIIFLIVGYGLVSIAQTEHALYLAMGVILAGNVFFKTNATNYVGRCFESNDPRLDSAFTYFYMAINIGSFSSILIVPIVSQVFDSYKMGLGLTSLAMIVALISYIVLNSKFRLADNNTGKNGKNLLLKTFMVGFVAIGLSYVLGLLLTNLELCKIALYSIAGITVLIYLFVASRFNHKEAKGMYVALILLVFAIVFFMLYMQTATSMTLFALHNVRLDIMGFAVPAGVTQSLNPFFIIFLSPILANLYIKLHKGGISYTIPAKFLTGILLTGMCFITLAFAAQFFADDNSQVSVLWMVVAYAFYSAGELLVSALGASMVAQLVPKRLGGFAQGMWFLASGVGMKVGGQLSGYAALNHGEDTSASLILHSYTNFFYELGGLTFIIAVVLFFTIKPLNKAMNYVLSNKY